MSDRNMLLTVDEYLALRRLIDSETESEGAREEATVTKRTRKPRKTAYQRFVADQMPKHKRKYPRAKPQAHMKRIAKEWKTSTKNPNRKRRRR
mgnify:FL=1